MWTDETISTWRTHEARPKGTFGLDSEISEAGIDRRSSTSSAGLATTNCDGARADDTVREGSERSHTHAGSVSTARGREHDRTVVEGDQLANLASGICASEEAILGSPSVGKGVFGGEHR